MAYFVQIDSDGNPCSSLMIYDNIVSLMGTVDFTEEELNERGFATVINSDEPFVSDRYNATRGEVVKNENGEIEQLWDIVEISTEEKYNRWIERKRHSLLYMSDWTQLPDSPLSTADKQLWADYRQALRDLPQNTDIAALTSIEDVEWPLPPGTPDPNTLL